LHSEFLARADQLVAAVARACAKQVRKRLPWCMIRASEVSLAGFDFSPCVLLHSVRILFDVT
jgi:hypothetical protein